MYGPVPKLDKLHSVEMTAHSARLRRHNRDDQSNQQGLFKDMLAQTMAKQKSYKPQAETEGRETEAAVWEGNGVTQSLFYQKGVNLDFFYR